jgi:hypothetical protein
MTIVAVPGGLEYHDDSLRVCIMNRAGRTLVNRSVCNDVEAVSDLIQIHANACSQSSSSSPVGAAPASLATP